MLPRLKMPLSPRNAPGEVSESIAEQSPLISQWGPPVPAKGGGSTVLKVAIFDPPCEHTTAANDRHMSAHEIEHETSQEIDHDQ